MNVLPRQNPPGTEGQQNHPQNTPGTEVQPNPPTATSQDKPAKPGVPPGAVAGAAVGGLVGGAIIAAILVFFLLRKRQNRSATYRYSRSPHERQTKPEKMPVVQTRSVGTVDEYLPQVVDDDVVKTEVSKIRDNIRNHVRTYYHSNGIADEHLNTSQLDLLGTATGVSSSTLVAALVDPSTRTQAICLLVAWTILARVGPESPSSLLPAVLSPLASIFADDGEMNQASATLFSKWKVITGVLLQQRQGKQGVSQQAATEALDDLDRMLGPFVSAGADGVQRRKNLEMILNRARSLSLLLFSQPGSYRFDFAIPRGGLTVFPALLQTVNSSAKPLVPPKVLWEKETMAPGDV